MLLKHIARIIPSIQVRTGSLSNNSKILHHHLGHTGTHGDPKIGRLIAMTLDPDPFGTTERHVTYLYYEAIIKQETDRTTIVPTSSIDPYSNQQTQRLIISLDS
jgi:hypothetical protein